MWRGSGRGEGGGGKGGAPSIGSETRSAAICMLQSGGAERSARVRERRALHVVRGCVAVSHLAEGNASACFFS